MLKEMAEFNAAMEGVLILILMEHAQRVREFNSIPNKICWVLILILMEHAQRDNYEQNRNESCQGS